jgi:hypothetical protein
MRKWIQGRGLTFSEIAERINLNPKTMFYHRNWRKPVSANFLQNWQVRLLRNHANRGWICEAIPNPAYKAKHQGGSTND